MVMALVSISARFVSGTVWPRGGEAASRATALVAPHQARLAGYLQSRQSAIRLRSTTHTVRNSCVTAPTLGIYLNV